MNVERFACISWFGKQVPSTALDSALIWQEVHVQPKQLPWVDSPQLHNGDDPRLLHVCPQAVILVLF